MNEINIFRGEICGEGSVIKLSMTLALTMWSLVWSLMHFRILAKWIWSGILLSFVLLIFGGITTQKDLMLSQVSKLQEKKKKKKRDIGNSGSLIS